MQFLHSAHRRENTKNKYAQPLQQKSWVWSLARLLAIIYKDDSVDLKEPDITREAKQADVYKFNTMLSELLLHPDIMLQYGILHQYAM